MTRIQPALRPQEMYSIRKLASVAWDGLDDMLPAVRQALSESSGLERLELVYGPWPRATIAALAVLSLVLGYLFEAFGPELPGKAFVTWPAVFLGLLFSLLLRRFLFGGRRAGAGDFPLLAASLIPGVGILMLGVAVSGHARATLALENQHISLLGDVALWLVGLLGVAAAVVIAVASLCYSRSWAKALTDLAVRLLVFRIMIWVTALIMIEVGLVGTILGAMLEGLFGLRLPQWLPEMVDELSYAGLLAVAYLAVIGGTWTVCRDEYANLLEARHIDILKRLAGLIEKPKDEQQAPTQDPGEEPPT